MINTNNVEGKTYYTVNDSTKMFLTIEEAKSAEASYLKFKYIRECGKVPSQITQEEITAYVNENKTV